MKGGELVKSSALKLIRLQKGLKAQVVADLLGVSRSYYSKIENKSAVLTMENRIKLAAIFECKPVDLI